MDQDYFGIVEMAFSFGVVLAIGFWQLHSVTKAKKKRAGRARADRDKR